MQGAADHVCEALGRGDLANAAVSDAERTLLSWVQLLTRESHRNTASDVDRVREAGWSDEQMAETVYITALFALFNRVADAFGLDRWHP